MQVLRHGKENTIAYGTLPNSTQLESNSSLQITNGATDWLQIKSITTNGNIVDIVQNEIKNDSTSSNWITESKINFYTPMEIPPSVQSNPIAPIPSYRKITKIHSFTNRYLRSKSGLDNPMPEMIKSI